MGSEFEYLCQKVRPSEVKNEFIEKVDQKRWRMTTGRSSE
jgi:hypothetical protein